MRSRNLISVVGLFAVLAMFVAVIGCSDDDSPTTPSEPVTYDTPPFSDLQSQVESSLNSTVTLVGDGLSMPTVGREGLDGEIVFGPVPADSNWQEAGWNVYVLGAASAQIYGVDSIMFRLGGNAINDPANADQILYKHIYEYTADNQTGSYTNYAIASDLDLTGLDGTTATINGSYDISVQSQTVGTDMTFTWDYDVQGDFTNVTVDKSGANWGSGCPNSGTAAFTVTATYDSNVQDPVTATWSFDVTFTDGQIDVTATDGTNNQTYSSNLCTAN